MDYVKKPDSGKADEERLLNADQAIIDPRKLTDYALNPDHPTGGNKAKVFESALGITQANAEVLLEQIQQGVANQPPVPGKVDQFSSHSQSIFRLSVREEAELFVPAGFTRVILRFRN